MNRIKKYRLQVGMTQSQLAAAIKKTTACVSQYENGIHIPPIPVAKKIAKLVGCDWTEIYEED